MNVQNKVDLIEERRKKNWLRSEDASLELFQKQTRQHTNQDDWPLAQSVEKNILIYDGDQVREAARNTNAMQALTAEWNDAFRLGPGVIVIKNAVPDTSIVDRATDVFHHIIADQRKSQTGGGDHFAKPGVNDRIWNALQKHCIADPENFAQYYANAALALASLAWVGPGYQVTAQVNMVNPGGDAQSAHRDYHLGFMTTERALEYPAICHELSPFMTLQGGFAHCDMPIESGPTKLLPYSQLFKHGYAVFTQSDYQDHFEENHVQIAMEKGDAVFFNPALMHAAGANRSKDILRMVNLFQISSAFGRPIETVDRVAMAKALYAPLQNMLHAGSVKQDDLNYVIDATAEGYPFSTNLDTDPPVGGLVPKSQAQFMAEALEKNMSAEDFNDRLDQMTAKRTA